RPEDPPKDPPVAPAARSAAPASPAGERRLKKPADIVFGRSECGRYFTIDEEDLYEDATDPASVEAWPQRSPPDPGGASAASGSPQNERTPPEIGGRPGAVPAAGPSCDPRG
ncbi:MAG: hypothetical protein HXY23_03805, partial [Parvularculaceae bacterium]|nr:hypothetical protein [Parvularculaceae bacterium]